MEPKYKLKDCVMCVKAPVTSKTRHDMNNNRGAGWQEGYVFQVIIITNLIDPIYWPGKNDSGVYEDQLVKVKTMEEL